MNFLVALGLLCGLALSLTATGVQPAKAAANVGAAASYCQLAANCLRKGKGGCKTLQKLCDKEMRSPEPQ